MVHTYRDFKKSLQLALIITALFFIVELAGGLISGSLALVSDAGHMFSDVLALLLSLGAITIAARSHFGFFLPDISFLLLPASRVSIASSMILIEFTSTSGPMMNPKIPKTLSPPSTPMSMMNGLMCDLDPTNRV